jgi:hypothetical protein
VFRPVGLRRPRWLARLQVTRSTDGVVANGGKLSNVHRMSTVTEIETAVEKLAPQDLREFVAWFEERQGLLNASDALFRMYDEEEERAS